MVRSIWRQGLKEEFALFCPAVQGGEGQDPEHQDWEGPIKKSVRTSNTNKENQDSPIRSHDNFYFTEYFEAIKLIKQFHKGSLNFSAGKTMINICFSQGSFTGTTCLQKFLPKIAFRRLHRSHPWISHMAVTRNSINAWYQACTLDRFTWCSFAYPNISRIKRALSPIYLSTIALETTWV